MQKRNRWIPALLIMGGILLLLYPAARDRFYDWKQEKLLDQLVESAPQAFPARTQTLAAASEELTSILEQPEPGESSEQPTPERDDETNGRAIAIIEIEAIGLRLPVLEGATKANMKIAAAHMAETSAIGEPGNSAIAAHRAHKAGRLFNRLGEVSIGDKIAIYVGQSKYEYETYRITFVKPTDLSVLEPDGDLETLTLITCDPLVNPTHRLIVQAKRTGA